jgi:hypothetical protein
MLALVDKEWMRITSVTLTPTLGVVPGYDGSAAVNHGVLAPVIYGLTSEFTQSGNVVGVSEVAAGYLVTHAEKNSGDAAHA